MTNTRLTDPEVLEMRYPVRLVEFCVRQGSGGAGRCPGGDGVRRTYQFLEPVTVSLLTSRRNRPPFGLSGGGPGAVGENWLLSPNGQTERLQANCQVQVQPGQRVSISTPGGGGFGSA
jgi:5-oxoprolinase (ATP-hydrolysing)